MVRHLHAWLVSGVVALTVLGGLGVTEAAEEGPAAAELSRAQVRGLSAAPDAPRFSLGTDAEWIIAGRFSALIPMWGDDGEGGFGALIPMAELDGYIIPYERWRGRLAAEFGWSGRLGADGTRIELSAGAMHESDHQTVPDGVYTVALVDCGGADRQRNCYQEQPISVVLNDVFARAEVRRTLGGWWLSLAALPRLHLLTCTTLDADCHLGTNGHATFEVAGEALAVRDRAWVAGWHVFTAAAGSWMAAHRWALGEWRVDGRLGLAHLGDAGTWQWSLDGRYGHPVGVRRGSGEVESRLALSVGWNR